MTRLHGLRQKSFQYCDASPLRMLLDQSGFSRILWEKGGWERSSGTEAALNTSSDWGYDRKHWDDLDWNYFAVLSHHETNICSGQDGRKCGSVSRVRNLFWGCNSSRNLQAGTRSSGTRRALERYPVEWPVTLTSADSGAAAFRAAFICFSETALISLGPICRNLWMRYNQGLPAPEDTKAGEMEGSPVSVLQTLKLERWRDHLCQSSRH